MTSSLNVRVERITSRQDIPAAFEVNCAAFGVQLNDGIWSAIFPGWDTPAGKEQAVTRLASLLEANSTTVSGQPTTVFIKATVPALNGATHERVIAGFAIWIQASMIHGYGQTPLANELSDEDLETIHPGNAKEQRYLRQLLLSLHKRRSEVLKEKAVEIPPAVFVLDSCAVDPAFQRRGVATQLVRWGLDEAERRGGLECITEASVMGRHVYLREGFEAEGPDMTYTVDDEFAARDRPPNVFLRTRKDGKNKT